MPPKVPPGSLSSASKAIGQSKTLEAVSDPVLGEVGDQAASTLATGGSTAGSSTVEALQDLGGSRLESRASVMRSQLFFQLFGRLPYPLIMVLPFIREDSKRLMRQLQLKRQQQPADTDTAEPLAAPEPRSQRRPDTPSPYTRYRCIEHPLTCSQLHQGPLDSDTNHCQRCGFPGLLRQDDEIRGKQGRYRVGEFLGHRGIARLYRGHEVNRRQPVVIREYLLPFQHFNPGEQQVTRDTFETIAGLKLADGREQDFRLIDPWDAIGDRNQPERCYLITQGVIDTFPTLRTVITAQGALTQQQVRQILNQVLQTLESLHGQTYVLPAGQMQTGLVHGNLTLDSLVLLPDSHAYYESPQQLVFLRDLFLWESLFMLQLESPQLPQPQDDWAALGHIGLALLAGRWQDDHGRPLKPRSPEVWPGRDLPLEQYLRQLLAIEEPSFGSAAEARQALLQLPPPPAPGLTTPTLVTPSAATPKRQFPLWLLLAVLAVLGVLGTGLLGWWIWRRRAIASASPPVCCVADVAAVPPGQFTYTSARQGIWYPLWHSRNLVVQGKTLEQVLEIQQPDLNLQLVPALNNQAAIEQVRQDGAEFAIAPLPNNRPLDFTVTPIAYDGLAVFVAFSYVERARGLPQHLQGAISLAQLRQLYTGEISNWQDLGGPNLPVKLYIPDQPELIEIFEQQVLQTPEAIATFRRLWGLEQSPTLEQAAIEQATIEQAAIEQAAIEQATIPKGQGSLVSSPEIESSDGEALSTLAMLRRVLQDFEADAQLGSIGFASMSQIYGQCSVYPLAIATDDAAAVQPLSQQDGMPISPAIDLCGDKGNYAPEQSLFAQQIYPLAYPLAVLYRPDNSRLPIGPIFVQMMTTDEGQEMLTKTGLVPLAE